MKMSHKPHARAKTLFVPQLNFQNMSIQYEILRFSNIGPLRAPFRAMEKRDDLNKNYVHTNTLPQNFK